MVMHLKQIEDCLTDKFDIEIKGYIQTSTLQLHYPKCIMKIAFDT